MAAVDDCAVACWPAVRPTAATVPLIGLTIVAWARFWVATLTWAWAASTAAWSATSWAAEGTPADWLLPVAAGDLVWVVPAAEVLALVAGAAAELLVTELAMAFW